MGPDTKEYYELQSDIWFNECWKRMKERDAYKKQRDELINDMEEVKRKAKAFDEMVKIYNQKNDLPSDEIFMIMGYCISDLERGSDG